MPDGVDYAPPLPPAVQRARERAEELQRQASEAANPTTVENTEGKDDQPAAEGQPPTPVSPPAPVTPAPTTDWEQRYNTLQGKYNHEIGALNNQVRQQEQRLGQMQELIASMRSAPPAAPAPAPAPAPATVPDEDVQAYGQDLVQATRRWARAEVTPEIETLRQQVAGFQSEIQRLNGVSQQTSQETRQERVKNYLDARLPVWRQINDDQGFLGWLSQLDPFSGDKRHDLLQKAYNQGDPERTLSFFRAYQDEHTAVAQAPPASAHTPDNGAGKIPLEQLAAPGRGSATPAAQGAPGKRIWSQADIAAFYRDAQRGRFNDDPAAKLRIEQDIFAAMNEGRVR